MKPRGLKKIFHKKRFDLPPHKQFFYVTFLLMLPSMSKRARVSCFSVLKFLTYSIPFRQYPCPILLDFQSQNKFFFAKVENHVSSIAVMRLRCNMLYSPFPTLPHTTRPFLPPPPFFCHAPSFSHASRLMNS